MTTLCYVMRNQRGTRHGVTSPPWAPGVTGTRFSRRKEVSGGEIQGSSGEPNADQLTFWPHHSDPEDLGSLDTDQSILFRVITTLMHFL